MTIINKEGMTRTFDGEWHVFKCGTGRVGCVALGRKKKREGKRKNKYTFYFVCKKYTSENKNNGKLMGKRKIAVSVRGTLLLLFLHYEMGNLK